MAEDFVYPRKVVVPAEPVSLLTNTQIRDRVITLLESGVSRKMALLKVISEATGAGAVWPRIVETVFNRIQDDIVALKAVDALKCATAVEFKAALDAVAQVVPTVDWTDHLQVKYDITTGTAAEKFAALKVKLQAELDAAKALEPK